MLRAEFNEEKGGFFARSRFRLYYRAISLITTSFSPYRSNIERRKDSFNLTMQIYRQLSTLRRLSLITLIHLCTTPLKFILQVNNRKCIKANNTYWYGAKNIMNINIKVHHLTQYLHIFHRFAIILTRREFILYVKSVLPIRHARRLLKDKLR